MEKNAKEKKAWQGDAFRYGIPPFLKGEMGQFFDMVNRHAFNHLWAVSAIAGAAALIWAASAFAGSPATDALARLGLAEASRASVPWTDRLTATVVPALAGVAAAYLTHKVLAAFREMQVEIYEARAARLDNESLSRLKARLDALENARAEGILSWGEYRAKLVNVYQPFVGRLDPKAARMDRAAVRARQAGA